jgi:hypothetical protein
MTAKLRELADLLVGRVPDAIVEEFNDYIQAGEPKIGIEALCDALYDGHVPLQPDEAAAIRASGHELGVRRRSFQLIDELVKR